MTRPSMITKQQMAAVTYSGTEPELASTPTHSLCANQSLSKFLEPFGGALSPLTSPWPRALGIAVVLGCPRRERNGEDVPQSAKLSDS